ncbi:MAG: UbiA family prenyltransferase [Vicinamibacterales bacterium]
MRPLLSRQHSALRLLHYWWPVALGWSVAVVVRRATGRAWDPAGLALLLGGITTAYSLDRLLDPPAALPRWLWRTLAGASMAGLLAGAWLLPGLPRRSIAAAGAAGLLAVAYPLVKRVPLVKTLLVPLVWTACGIVLPVAVGAAPGWWAEPVAVPLFLLFVAGCLLCDLKDAARDRATGVPSVPALFGRAAARQMAVAIAVVAAGAAVLTGRPALALSAATLSGVALTPALVETDVIGPLVVDVIMTLPGLLIVAHLV